MTVDATGAGLAAVVDALALVQAQLDRVERSNGRLEAAQRDILGRLDTIDAGQAAVTDLLPVLEMLLARSIEDRELSTRRFGRVAQLAALAHAAALGNGAPLPVEVADDELLERHRLTQPSDRTSSDRALVDWRKEASGTGSAELAGILARQYRPSPTETAEARVLRYRLAAITRAEIEGRGGRPPGPPAAGSAEDRSPAARRARSDDLAALWRAGASAALYAEAELAGALDLFAAAERRGGGIAEDRLSAELAELHRSIGERLASGERPSAPADSPGDAGLPRAVIKPDLARQVPQPGRRERD